MILRMTQPCPSARGRCCLSPFFFPDCRVLGAVFLLRPTCHGSEIQYLTHFIENESAAPLCGISVPVSTGLSANNLLNPASNSNSALPVSVANW